MAYVDKSTPLIVAMHAQIYKPTSTGFAFDHDSANTEALLAASGLEAGELSLLLMNLELSGAVRRLPGKRYVKI